MMSYYAQTTAPEAAEREAQDLEEPGDILAALESRDGPERAERLMRQHIEGNCEELLSGLDARDSLGARQGAVVVSKEVISELTIERS